MPFMNFKINYNQLKTPLLLMYNRKNKERLESLFIIIGSLIPTIYIWSIPFIIDPTDNPQCDLVCEID